MPTNFAHVVSNEVAAPGPLVAYGSSADARFDALIRELLVSEVAREDHYRAWLSEEWYEMDTWTRRYLVSSIRRCRKNVRTWGMLLPNWPAKDGSPCLDA